MSPSHCRKPISSSSLLCVRSAVCILVELLGLFCCKYSIKDTVLWLMSGFVVFLQQAYETMRVNNVFTILTIVVGVAQCPRLVWVKVCVASYSRPWKVGMGQEAPLAIEGWAVSVETWSEDDGDVHIFLAPLQLAVGHSLEAQRRHALPHVEGSPNGVVGLLSTHFGCHVLYAAEMGDKKTGGK